MKFKRYFILHNTYKFHIRSVHSASRCGSRMRLETCSLEKLASFQNYTTDWK